MDKQTNKAEKVGEETGKQRMVNETANAMDKVHMYIVTVCDNFVDIAKRVTVNSSLFSNL